MHEQTGAPVTIYTVAEHAGVSIATVSRVLQGSTPTSPAAKAKVMRAVEELGYVPLRTGRNPAMRLETHGLVMRSVSGQYYSNLLAGYESSGTDYGQSVMLIATDGMQDAAERVIDLAAKVDGMVIALETVSDTVVNLVASRIPVVLVARDPVPGCDLVQIENDEPTYRITTHLIEDHGLTRLAFVGAPINRDSKERYAAFQAALENAGLPDPGFIPVELNELAGPHVAQHIASDKTGIQGLVCANDDVALGAMRALGRAGLQVGSGIAVTGWDDVMAANYTTPGLTTVRQPTVQLGRFVAERLHNRIINDSRATAPVRLDAQVIIRGSCGCPEE